MASLSMPQSRKVIRKQEEIAAQLRKEIRAAGLTGVRKQRKAIQAAASGRPSDLAERARKSLEDRRAIAMVERLQGGGQ